MFSHVASKQYKIYSSHSHDPFMQRTRERFTNLFRPTSSGTIIYMNAFIKMDDIWEALVVETLIKILKGVFHSFNFL